jgi:hypothetical protein
MIRIIVLSYLASRTVSWFDPDFTLNLTGQDLMVSRKLSPQPGLLFLLVGALFYPWTRNSKLLPRAYRVGAIKQLARLVFSFPWQGKFSINSRLLKIVASFRRENVGSRII